MSMLSEVQKLKAFALARTSSSFVSWVRFILGLGIGFGIIVAIWNFSTRLDWETILRRITWWHLLVPFFLHMGMLLLSGLQIAIFIRKLSQVSVLEVIKQYYTSLVAGILLPNLFGELLIVPLLLTSGVSARISTAAFALSKLINSIFLLLVALTFLILMHYGGREILFAIGVIALFLSPVVIVLIPPLRRYARKVVARIAQKWIGYFEGVSVLIRHSKAATCLIFGLGVGKHLLAFVYVWFILHSLGGKTPLFMLAGASAIGTLAGIASITPRNLGILEGTLVLFTVSYGDPAQLILLASLLGRFIGHLDMLVSFLVLRAGSAMMTRDRPQNSKHTREELP